MNKFFREIPRFSSVLRPGIQPTNIPMRCIVTDLRPSETPTIGSPAEDKLKELEFPPFVKDIFAGVFNKSILSYAEVLNYERYFVLLEQTRQISRTLSENKQQLERVDKEGRIPEDILMKLKAVDLNGLLVPGEYGGSELMNTEALRLLQELGANLSLSELYNINEMFCTKCIVKYGSEEQKKKYLERICSGDLWTAFCFTETGAGSDPNSVKTKAVWDAETNQYTLRGTKTWVSNAIRANLFLVFANVSAKNYLGEFEDCLCAFLVDGDTPGVEVSPAYDLAGFNGLQVCDVKFDCNIPVSSVLGEPNDGLEIYNNISHESKYFMAAGIVTRLKNLLDETVQHSLERKQYGTKLSDFELIKMEIAKCTSRIYALESMLYITSGLADVGSKPDIWVESAIVKQFAVETYDYVTRRCLAILGVETNRTDSKYQRYLAENQILQSWQGSSNIIKCFIAISGIIHVAEQKGDHLLKCKKPGLHPVKSLKYSYYRNRHIRDKFPKKFMLENHVHPRLALVAPLVEWSAHKLAFCTEELLIRDGLNVQIREVNLERLSDIAMETYAMVCALSRASRSYVVGHPHSQHEINLAIPFIFESRQRAEDRVQQIIHFDTFKGQRDAFYEDAGSYVIEQGGYCAVNPLMKNSS